VPSHLGNVLFTQLGECGGTAKDFFTKERKKLHNTKIINKYLYKNIFFIILP